MNEQLDQDAVNLAKAIRQTESQNNPSARGASGEYGAYQFLPQTWASSSQKYLGRSVPLEMASLPEQNEVAYKQIKEWKDAGYNPGQIASMWNAGPGKPNAYLEGNKGVNSKGVPYDTAEYARKVAETYQSFKRMPVPQGGATAGASTSATPPHGGGVASEPIAPRKSFGEKVLGVGQSVSNFFGGKGVTDLIGGAIARSNLPEEQKGLVDMPTPAQVAGSAVQLGTLALPIGTMARGITSGVKALGAGERAATAVGTYGSGAAAGGVFGAGQAIQEGQTAPEAVRTIAENAAFGAAAPAVIDTLGYGARAIGASRANKAISNLERGYVEAFSGTKTGLKGVAKSARAGHNDAKFLANKGITLELTDGGTKYSTETARQALQADMDVLDDVLTKSLKNVRASIDLDRVEAAALKKVDNKFTQAEGTSELRKEQVKRIFKTYRKIYGDYVGADILNEIKRGQRRLSGVFDASRPHFASDVHYQIGDVAKKEVENAAKGAGLPEIADFNKYYSQHANAFKALEKLHGNAIKGGKMGRYLTRHIAGLAGAMAGTVSHGPVGTLAGLIAGEAAGGAASKMFAKSRVANPLRDAILERLQKEDPEAVKAVINYLNRDNSVASKTTTNEAIAPMVTGKMAPTSGATRGLVDKNLLPGDILLGEKGRKSVENYISGYIQKPRLGLQLEDVSRGTAKKGVVGAPKNAFQGFNDLTTKLLEKLKGKTTTSKQEILDFTNSPDLKQPERDLFRRLLADEGDKVNVTDFANRVKSELLPLSVKPSGHPNFSSNKYEDITLPDDLRGPVAEYGERIYESPISTSAGGVHFSDNSKNYFAHTRVEDVGVGQNLIPTSKSAITKLPVGAKLKPASLYKDGDTRRVIEIQSDLFQKGRLESELPYKGFRGGENIKKTTDEVNERVAKGTMTRKEADEFIEMEKKAYAKLETRDKELDKLEPYRNTWHERVIREEVKQAAKDGKTKLQFPTGETAMKIEGLGTQGDSLWHDVSDYVDGDEALVAFRGGELKPNDLKVGQTISQVDNEMGSFNPDDRWIITDVLGDGKFKAVPKADQYEIAGAGGYDKWLEQMKARGADESFDISGKVDTENPIYKFYEKTVQKYLTNKYGGKVITDPQGVSWVEVDIKPEYKGLPVEAFGVAGLVPLTASQKQNEE